ncbi:tRNA wybutosine-synthesizing protein 3 like [Verticillium longisporum]|uniref:tRNA(Phe) 7-[(3-amino-3-carboxypropyl)-4-demethylwyosine(37)-N(4)]-methyltransferase n=1 Tax=Verticillium longisporum TaxID=100787 RepID=A0A8I3AQB4_VERLO|nr:tRNA wybutosine-synthesizing protein 3 like [Verticillium longisporum]RBQ86769.1 hypothetical protein VDGD_05000 [Verticillium dahliae]
MSSELSAPPASFVARKDKILQQLNVPVSDYTDLSPKGSVDANIRDLIDELNEFDGLVTTSSCGGRVSVFLEGRRDIAASSSGDAVDDRQTQAGVGGKGGGGTWLFVSHDRVDMKTVEDEDAAVRVMGLDVTGGSPVGISSKRLIHFKFEPMILHVLTASTAHAQLLLKCAFQSGFRESGALNITTANDSPITPLVAVRTMGLSFESLIGVESEAGRREAIVSTSYLKTLLDIGNDRFVENDKRIARFRSALRDAVTGRPAKVGENGVDWEDPAARKERKRAEGLRRQAEMATAGRVGSVADKHNESASDQDNDLHGDNALKGLF